MENENKEKKTITINKTFDVSNVVAFGAGAVAGVVIISAVNSDKPEVIADSVIKHGASVVGSYLCYKSIKAIFLKQ